MSSLLFFVPKLLHESPKHRSRDKGGRKPEKKIYARLFSSRPNLSVVASLFVVALAGIRTEQILREKVDCKQSKTIKGKII